MSIANYQYAKSWLADWMAEVAKGSQRARRFIIEAADRQRANLENVKLCSHSGWCTVEEYERSVQLIEAAAQQLKQETIQ